MDGFAEIYPEQFKGCKEFKGQDVTAVGIENLNAADMINILFPYGLDLCSSKARSRENTIIRIKVVDKILNKYPTSV